MRACKRIATKAVVRGRREPTAKLPVHSVLKPRSGSAPLRMVRSGRVLFSLSQDRISVEEAATKAASSFRMSDVGGGFN